MPRSTLLQYNELFSLLTKLRLKPVLDTNCLFSNDKLIVFFYIDDIVVLCHLSNIFAYHKFKEKLLDAYKMREMGELKWFLGIRIIRDKTLRKIWLYQDLYITKICNKYRNKERINKTLLTPISTQQLQPYKGTATKAQILEYSQIVGSCTYSTAITRPDIAFTTKQLAKSLQNPGPQHFNAAHKCLDYLEATKHYAIKLGMLYTEHPIFAAASDAAYADDPITRQSTKGSIFQLFGSIIDQQSKKQAIVTILTTKAKLLALSHISAWLLQQGRLFLNINLNIKQELTVYCDNLQIVGLIIKDSPKLITKLKHINIH